MVFTAFPWKLCIALLCYLLTSTLCQRFLGVYDFVLVRDWQLGVPEICRFTCHCRARCALVGIQRHLVCPWLFVTSRSITHGHVCQPFSLKWITDCLLVHFCCFQPIDFYITFESLGGLATWLLFKVHQCPCPLYRKPSRSNKHRQPLCIHRVLNPAWHSGVLQISLPRWFCWWAGRKAGRFLTFLIHRSSNLEWLGPDGHRSQEKILFFLHNGVDYRLCECRWNKGLFPPQVAR